MIKLSNSYLVKVVTRLLILLAIAKSISLAIWWFLPSDGIELLVEQNYKPKYQRVDFKNMINSVVAKKEVKEKAVVSGVNITSMVLKGLYGKGSTGFAIVALKSSPKKTSIISVGEIFSGYTLKTIHSNSVVFTKAKKEYILSMENGQNINKKAKVKKKKVSKKAKMLKKAAQVAKVEAPKKVRRKDIQYYADNPKQIWKDISISEVKKGKRIEGFKVNRINKRSAMARLGLRKGDVIIEANNVKLKSYKDALNLYKDIGDLNSIQLVVMRKNKEVELVYEIN